MKHRERTTHAKRAIREALTEAGFSGRIDTSKLVVAEGPETEISYYELYVPGDTPRDAKFIAKATVDSDGATNVEVFPENFALVQEKEQ
jgi:hypothetical protein